MNEQQFTAIYQEQYSDLYRFVFSYLKTKERTEDVLQETFLKLFDHSIKDEKGIRSWLFSTSKNLCVDLLRKERKELSLFDEERIEGESENYSEVFDMVASLPDKYGEIIRLHYFGNASVKEIACYKKMSEDGVKKRLQRAREKLKEMMKGEQK